MYMSTMIKRVIFSFIFINKKLEKRKLNGILLRSAGFKESKQEALLNKPGKHRRDSNHKSVKDKSLR